ncbi:S1-like domain-containing RNA-binding protein [Olivibacter ginsenosidimutans]|uniref:S1-like domain-containing RNA-binding protein n=1 Tax=Olivibacter ginsenosidimutans TaxID=1176537 RepID=A0ABP9AFR7_9SPHI
MIAIGKINTLTVTDINQLNCTLSDGENQVNLSDTDSSSPLKKGDQLAVFVYTNKSGQLSATTKRPYAEADQFAYLKVVDENAVGVFMDLGIEKDLFIPKKEQRWPMVKGKSYVVYIYLDEGNNHLVGSTKIHKFIDRETHPLEEKQEVELLIGEETDLGYNAIINNRYIGLLYANEVFEDLRVGNKRKGWIKKIYDDGKIDLSLQEQGYGHILNTKDAILDKLKKNRGHLALGDKSSPEEIYQTLKISKKAFKKAIGALYKERLLTISDEYISLLNADSSSSA